MSDHSTMKPEASPTPTHEGRATRGRGQGAGRKWWQLPVTRGWVSLNVSQVILLVVGLVAAALIIDFTQRIQAAQRIVAEVEILEREVATLEAEQADLKDELEYVQSDEYVEHWAHSQGRYVRPGEVLVIPVFPTVPAPANPPQLIEAADDSPEVWELWFELFFGS